MGTHPIFESDFDCLTVMQLSAVRRGVQTPFMKWMTQFVGGRTAAADEYMRYTNYQAPRTYPARDTPPSKNEKLHSAADGVNTPIQASRPTPGFGCKWSLNAEDPVIRTYSDFGLKPGRDYDQGYSAKDFYQG